MAKISMNGRNFKSKETLSNYFKYYLKTLNKEDTIQGVLHEDLLWLVNQHPNKEEKIGVGVKEFKVQRFDNPKIPYLNNSQHFHIYRSDGTDVDFSYKECIRNIRTTKTGRKKNSDHVRDVKQAMRCEVIDQIMDFKSLAFGNKRYLECEILGINFSKKTCNVDHENPLTFDRLIFNFMRENSLVFSDISIKNYGDGYIEISEDVVKYKWKMYHKENAKLRVIHKTANMVQPKEKINWGEITGGV